nr:hypothetical protein Itr_chr02CG26380 [Ipomoea trifida]
MLISPSSPPSFRLDSPPHEQSSPAPVTAAARLQWSHSRKAISTSESFSVMCSRWVGGGDWRRDAISAARSALSDSSRCSTPSDRRSWCGVSGGRVSSSTTLASSSRSFFLSVGYFLGFAMGLGLRSFI